MTWPRFLLLPEPTDGSQSRVKRRERRTFPCFASSFEADLSGFLSWVQLEKGLARNTVASYEADLIQCADCLFSQGVANWREVRIEHLSEWLASLTEDAYAVASLSRKLSAVRMLAKYMVGEGILREDFHRAYDQPQEASTFARLSCDRRNRSLSSRSRPEHSAWKKGPGLVRVDVWSGLRVSEISPLR